MDSKCGIFIFVLTVLTATWMCSGNRDRVLLKDLTSITLRQGQMTTGRRSSSVYQLQCTGGFAGCSVPQPKIVQCYNRGFDGRDVQWECKGQMEKRYKFGRISVSCEGYDYPEDPYILYGSCGLEYELDYTDTDYQNDEEYYHHEPYRHHHDDYHRQGQGWTRPVRQSSVVGSVIAFVIVGFLIFACCKMCQSASHASGSAAASGSGPTPTQGSGPGFWSGAGIGGALGYLFGRGGGGGYRRRGYYGGGGGYYGGGSGYYGGGSRGMFRGGGGYRSSHSSSSGTTHTSSGFGGTKRR